MERVGTTTCAGGRSSFSAGLSVTISALIASRCRDRGSLLARLAGRGGCGFALSWVGAGAGSGTLTTAAGAAVAVSTTLLSVAAGSKAAATGLASVLAAASVASAGAGSACGASASLLPGSPVFSCSGRVAALSPPLRRLPPRRLAGCPLLREPSDLGCCSVAVPSSCPPPAGSAAPLSTASSTVAPPGVALTSGRSGVGCALSLAVGCGAGAIVAACSGAAAPAPS